MVARTLQQKLTALQLFYDDLIPAGSWKPMPCARHIERQSSRAPPRTTRTRVRCRGFHDTEQAKKFERAHANSCMIEVLIDGEAIMSGAAAAGTPWKYYPLGNSDLCTNPLYNMRPHRMACARCDFHLPAASHEGAALADKQEIQRRLEEVRLDPDERAAIEGGVEAMDNLIAKPLYVPTPDGRTPAEMS